MIALLSDRGHRPVDRRVDFLFAVGFRRPPHRGEAIVQLGRPRRTAPQLTETHRPQARFAGFERHLQQAVFGDAEFAPELDRGND
ncbi:MAG: hypothetical protein M3Q65_08775 [Chloroflexota bacterium]|nr:hypothetical protein [Chloroflexota bacterium]